VIAVDVGLIFGYVGVVGVVVAVCCVVYGVGVGCIVGSAVCCVDVLWCLWCCCHALFC